MPDLLTFGGAQLGDLVLRVAPVSAAMTPPVVQSAVWREAALIDTGSRNMLYGVAVAVHIARATHYGCAAAVAAVQSRLGTRGVLRIMRVGSGVKLQSDDQWVFQAAAAPAIAAGSGGRLCTDWELTFVGSAPPQWYA